MTDELVIRTEYTCEVCEKVEVLSEDEAYNGGWDYPPFMGVWGVVSPRTCGNCGIQDTLWWKLAMEGVTNIDELDQRYQDSMARILKEIEEHRD